jgi:hypothetical protein
MTRSKKIYAAQLLFPKEVTKKGGLCPFTNADELIDV